MAGMHLVEFSPLPDRQRTKYWMVSDLDLGAQLGFTGADRFIHVGKIFPDSRQHLIGGHTFWHDSLRGFASAGDKLPSGHDGDSDPLLESHLAGNGLPVGSNFAQKFGGPAEGQRQVFQDLGRAPLPFRMPAQLLSSHRLRGRIDRLTRDLNIWVHSRAPCTNVTLALE